MWRTYPNFLGTSRGSCESLLLVHPTVLSQCRNSTTLRVQAMDASKAQGLPGPLGPLARVSAQMSNVLRRWLLAALVLVQSMCGDVRYGFVAMLLAEPMNANLGSMAVAANGVAAGPDLVVFVVEGVMVVAGIMKPFQRCKRHLPTIIRAYHASGIFVVDVVRRERAPWQVLYVNMHTCGTIWTP